LEIKNTKKLHLLLSERSRRERAVAVSTQQTRILERECGAGNVQLTHTHAQQFEKSRLTYPSISQAQGAAVAQPG
jgi:hypothetical protein